MPAEENHHDECLVEVDLVRVVGEYFEQRLRVVEHGRHDRVKAIPVQLDLRRRAKVVQHLDQFADGDALSEQREEQLLVLGHLGRRAIRVQVVSHQIGLDVYIFLLFLIKLS